MYTLGLDANSLMHKAKTLSPEDTLDDARSAMLKYNISRIVVSRDRKVVGMLTEKDIARFLYREVPSKRFGEIAINEVMTKKPVTIDEGAGLKTCARLMLEKEISSLIVVDGRKNIKGIFTKTDLVDAYVRHFAGEHTVKEFMTEKVITVAPDESIHMALLLMSGRNLSRVAVAKGCRPIGIITSKDLLPVAAIFGTGTIGSYWTTREDIVAKRKQQWYIPSGIKAAFIASDVMTPNPIVATADSDLADAAYVMLRNRISGLPVVDKEGTLAGIITKTDMVRALAEQRGEMKSLKRLPVDDTSIQMLSLARFGVSKKELAGAITLPVSQFGRHMAALVDMRLLHFDAQKRMWVTTDKGYAYLEGTQPPDDRSGHR